MAAAGKGSVKQLSRQVEGFAESIKKLHLELGKLEKGTKDYVSKQKELNKVLKDGTTASEKLSKAEKLLIQNNKNHASSVNAGKKAQDKFNKSVSDGAAQFKKANKAQDNFGNRLKSAISTISRFGIAFQILNGATRLFRELTIGSIKQAIEFEKSLANLGAVAGATSEEVKELGKNALAVAGQTKFTAQEIVGLQTELSKLGFSAKDVVESTQAIAFAAQALGSPLDATASLVGKLRNQFGLLVEETTMISDILVTSINESALSFDSFGVSMQYVGPIARTLGLSLEQTAGAMAVLADNGFTASRIGTGLRGILTELGKTSADAEQSLKKLAEQNISLSEAVNLVGKRNAAQLLTLLKNIDAIDTANDKYYQHGRALISAAKQADSFNGQMDILTSNFRQFQIGIGNSIVESGFFINVLGILSTTAQRTALGFKSLRDIGLDGFASDVNEIIDDGIDPLTSALDTFIEAGKVSTENLGELKRAIKGASEESKRLGTDILPSQEALEKLGVTSTQFSALKGYFDLLKKGEKDQRNQNAIIKGTAEATSIYKDEVQDLITRSIEGQNVNEDSNTLYKELEGGIDSYRRALNSSNGVTKEQEVQYKASIAVLKGYQEQVKNTQLNEAELEKFRKNQEKERISLRIKAINDETALEVNFLNERARVETLGAKTADKKADIERERQILVSDAYNKKAKSLADINVIYEENIPLVDKAISSAEKQAEVLGSKVISNAAKALKDYTKESDKLKKQFDENEIGLDDYNAALQRSQDEYREYIQALIETFDVSEEVANILLDLANRYDKLSVSIKSTNGDIKEGKKDWKDFTDELKETGWIDIASDAVDALGETLDEFNSTQLENTKATEQAKLEVIKERYGIEQQILASQLDNQLITESQFRQKQRELKKAQIAEENTINKSIFDAEKKEDVNNARIEGLEASAQAYLQAFQAYEPTTAVIVGSIGAAIAIGSATAQISAINQRKYVPKKFADGGVVNGPSHNEGGVPFSVQGQVGYEMEGGEYIINKRATSMHRDLLEKINKSGRTAPKVGSFKYAQGGLVNTPINESADYLKAIAEATSSTAIGVSKPVRAFVSDKDLRTDSNERRIRNRNDRV